MQIKGNLLLENICSKVSLNKKLSEYPNDRLLSMTVRNALEGECNVYWITQQNGLGAETEVAIEWFRVCSKCLGCELFVHLQLDMEEMRTTVI